MNVLQVTAWDTTGERFNGSLIHRALLDRGHRSSMFVRFKRGDDPHVTEAGSPLTRSLDNHVLIPLQRGLSLQALLLTSGFSLLRSRAFRECQLVHLQLIHASPFFSLALLPLLGRRRQVVCTVHDPWLTTGHCVHPMSCDRWRLGCGQCPDLDRPLPMRHDRTALMWKIKRSLFQDTNITLVVASRFMHDLVANSLILGGLPCRVIPFGVSTAVFHPGDRAAARARLGIAADTDVLALRHVGLEEPYKGGRMVVDALREYQPRRKTILIVFEESGDLEELAPRYQLMRLGWVTEPARVAGVLRAADLFLMPSAAEAFGLMAVESMACGTPVIVCDGTALPEVIEAPLGGLSVPQGDPSALARAIELLLESPEERRRMADDGARLARERYPVESYIQGHLDLYRQLVES